MSTFCKKRQKLAKDLIAVSGDVSDENEFMIRFNTCIESLQLYHNKVENQTGKVAEAVGDSDKELIKKLVSKNLTIWDEAMECVKHL